MLFSLFFFSGDFLFKIIFVSKCEAYSTLLYADWTMNRFGFHKIPNVFKMDDPARDWVSGDIVPLGLPCGELDLAKSDADSHAETTMCSRSRCTAMLGGISDRHRCVPRCP